MLSKELDPVYANAWRCQTGQRPSASITMTGTLAEPAEQIERALPKGDGLKEVVADKGYHSTERVVDLERLGVRSYISEPKRGRRRCKWDAEAREAIYGNRRPIKRARGLKMSNTTRIGAAWTGSACLGHLEMEAKARVQ